MRRFLEKQKDKITAVVFCTATSSDTEIYKRYANGNLSFVIYMRDTFVWFVNYEGFSLYITDCCRIISYPFAFVHCRLLPLYFPRDRHEEEVAILKLPADVGDENGETIIDERKIRIKPLPNVKKNVPRTPAPMDLPVSDVGLARRYVALQTHHVF